MRHIAFFRGSRGKQLFSPCFISFAQLRRVLQNPQQITVRIKAILLRRFNQAVDHGAGLRATGRIGKEPVLPAHHKGLNAALGTVVAQLQTAILQTLPGTATAPAGSEWPCPTQISARFSPASHLPMTTTRLKQALPAPAAFHIAPPVSALQTPAPA